MDEDERGLARLFRGRARRAMRLVADDEVEIGLMRRFGVQRLLRLDDLRKRLVGREHDAEPTVRLGEQVELLELAYNGIDIRRCGESKLFDGEAAVIDRFLLLRDFCVGTDAHRADGLGGICRPFVQRLPEERNGRDEE